MSSFKSLLPAALAGLLLGAGCEPGRPAASVPPVHVGQKCTVQFRRDALGMAGTLPAPPTSGELNGAAMTVVGTLRKVSGDWIIIESASETYVIPTQVILLIQYSDQP